MSGRADLRAEGSRPKPRAPSTRERLLQAAIEVIEHGGYAAASVAAIAERAGLATGALYRHFSSKEDLFVEVFRQAARRELEAMYASTAEADEWLGKFEAVVATFANRALHNRRLTWALVYEPVDPLVDAERLASRRSYCEHMAEHLRDAIAAGEIPHQNADLTAAAVVGAIAEALVGPLSPVAGETSPEDEIVAGIVAFCRQAIGAEGSTP